MTNITDTTTMRYNTYKQRTFLAQTNNARDIAIDSLKDKQTTKIAELYWSDPTEKAVALLKPSGGTKTDDWPQDNAKNPFAAGVIDIVDGPPAVGYHQVYTPQSVQSAIFDLRNDASSAAGFNQIRYIGNGQQLIEVKAQASVCATTTERNIVLSVYKNDKLIDTNLREIAVLKSAGADDTITNMEITLQTTVINGDLIKLVGWRTDGAGSANINFTSAGLRVMTLP